CAGPDPVVEHDAAVLERCRQARPAAVGEVAFVGGLSLWTGDPEQVPGAIIGTDQGVVVDVVAAAARDVQLPPRPGNAGDLSHDPSWSVGSWVCRTLPDPAVAAADGWRRGGARPAPHRRSGIPAVTRRCERRCWYGKTRTPGSSSSTPAEVWSRPSRVREATRARSQISRIRCSVASSGGGSEMLTPRNVSPFWATRDRNQVCTRVCSIFGLWNRSSAAAASSYGSAANSWSNVANGGWLTGLIAPSGHGGTCSHPASRLTIIGGPVARRPQS